jgi:hypothetical protein
VICHKRNAPGFEAFAAALISDDERLLISHECANRNYRRAYVRAFPEVDLTSLVLDHVMNRRVTRLTGFAYLRIVPISREANSSHGSLSEGWAVGYDSSPRMMETNRTSQAMVQYADLADLVKLLNIEGGGSFMENVNEAQKLVDPP